MKKYIRHQYPKYVCGYRQRTRLAGCNNKSTLRQNWIEPWIAYNVLDRIYSENLVKQLQVTLNSPLKK